MTKNEEGIWKVTTKAIEPDIYPYSFQVDGKTVMDPANVDYFPNERFKASLLEVPGDEPRMYEMKDVPHGALHYEYYPSLEGSTGSLVVYTPPGYDTSSDTSYPVFYLISGTTDTEETFYKVGKTHWILDNLIAAKMAVPMIVVMPYGNPAARIAEQNGTPKPDDPFGRDNPDAMVRMKQFETDLVQYIMPYVEQNYRTINKRESRAIGGFSRGGGQTLRTAYGNTDKFAWVCAYSAYLTPEEMDTSFGAIAGNPEQTNAQLKLNWVSVGNTDFLYQQTFDYMVYLNAKGVQFQSLIAEGGHTWMNVKKFVTETVPLLFKE